ncbi:putative tetraketide alpha-pyrone reductase 1-like [Capsicum annuum]|uniref:Protein translocase subunit SecA n=1 Tax=Capsicum annuum TaxID=4072 RepID=A0A2G2ZGQ7_CAPAN|nr:uncharacterized protein LOC107870407 isoform X1 [Capsicum annuum]KAF3675591.1 putative tetraketide alpha-pyrone reductase 1-like [Capsicum annuum]PHT81183.1 hypothetical protein T459_14198 [Capsicum annuum]
MGFGSLRSIIRPVSRALLSTRPLSAFTPITSPANTISPVTELRRNLFSTFRPKLPWIPPSNAASVAAFHSLTDTRLPKRRPSYKPKRKRASLRPPGPYAWVKYTPGEPISPNNPNEGSVKRRNEKKRIAQRKAFILAEKKKRKAQLQEANRKKMIKRVERKMAAVARDRAWAERLVELKKFEEEKKAAMA